MFNPFTKRTNEQKEAYKYNTQLEQDSHAYAHGMPANLTDEALWYEQKEERDQLTKWQQDLNPELQEFVHKLKKEVKGKDGKWERVLIGEVPMKQISTDEGIWEMVMMIEPLLSRNLMMTNYSDEIIQREKRRVASDFILHLKYYWKYYEIDPGNLSYLLNLFKSIVYPTFNRALNDGERRHQRSIYKDIFTHGERIEPQKKKLFGG